VIAGSGASSVRDDTKMWSMWDLLMLPFVPRRWNVAVLPCVVCPLTKRRCESAQSFRSALPCALRLLLSSPCGGASRLWGQCEDARAWRPGRALKSPRMQMCPLGWVVCVTAETRHGHQRQRPADPQKNNGKGDAVYHITPCATCESQACSTSAHATAHNRIQYTQHKLTGHRPRRMRGLHTHACTHARVGAARNPLQLPPCACCSAPG
jgi:hypothetical protein